MSDRATLMRILDRARWAPSGDNTQPWRFEILGDDRIRVHGHDTRDWCVYDLEGRASQIALGALLESIALAASGEGLSAAFALEPDSREERPVIAVYLTEQPGAAPDPLNEQLEHRVTQRRPVSSTPLKQEDKSSLEATVGRDYRVVWAEGAKQKWKMARILFRNAHIRLTIKEAFEVHRRIIEWDSQFSEDRIPDRAIGLDPLALKIMKWAMASWVRIRFLNRYLSGTVLPRLEMDVLPALGCAAHFLLVRNDPPGGIGDYFNAGRAVQRLWLSCAARGISFQPEMTPLIFAGYARAGVEFTENRRAILDAQELAAELQSLLGSEVLPRGVFLGRLGYGTRPTARSLRLPLRRLLIR